MLISVMELCKCEISVQYVCLLFRFSTAVPEL